MIDLVLRLIKGTKLTHAELDANFTNLNDGKVDKETGKSLVADTEIAKLATVAENANAYIHPVSHPATIITQTADYRFVTDTEKTNWNAKQSALSGASPLPITYVSIGGVAISGANTANGVLQLNATGHIPAAQYAPKTVLEVAVNTPINASAFGATIVKTTAQCKLMLPEITPDMIGKELVVVKATTGYTEVIAPAATFLGESRAAGSVTLTNQFSQTDFIRVTPVTETLYLVDGYGDIQFDVDLIS
jgi:hypothetical protein